MQILALKANLERVNTQWTNASGKFAKYQSDLEHANEVKEKLQHELNHKNSLLKVSLSSTYQISYRYSFCFHTVKGRRFC